MSKRVWLYQTEGGHYREGDGVEAVLLVPVQLRS
jgi:hypothetical protein